MLWWLVIPTAALISSVAILACGYAWVAWHATEVSIDSSVGKITAKIEDMQIRVQSAYAFLDQQQAQLQTYSEGLEKLLNDLKLTEIKNSGSTQLRASIPETKIVTDINGIITNLKLQSGQLINQKQNLESVKYNLQQFKQELSDYSKQYTKQKKQ